MIEITIVVIIAALFFIGGTFLGVLLGRRSKTANKAVDDIRREADELREKLREARAENSRGQRY